MPAAAANRETNEGGGEGSLLASFNRMEHSTFTLLTPLLKPPAVRRTGYQDVIPESARPAYGGDPDTIVATLRSCSLNGKVGMEQCKSYIYS